MNIDEAIDIAQNVICDEVIGTYCTEIQKEEVNCSKNCENQDCYLFQAIEIIINEYSKERENINKVLGMIFEYGQIDGDHHKAWVIDQIVRALTEDDYDKWVESYEYDEETGNEYEWNIGIAP